MYVTETMAATDTVVAEEGSWTQARRRRRSSTASPTSTITDEVSSNAVVAGEQGEKYPTNDTTMIAPNIHSITSTSESKKKKRKRKKKKKPIETKDDASERTETTTKEDLSIADDSITSPLLVQEEKQAPSDHDAAKSVCTTAQNPPFSKLLKLFQPEWPVCCFAILLMIGTEITSVVCPSLIASSYELLTDPDPDITHDERMSKINRIVQMVLLIHVAGNLCAWLRFSIVGVVSERVVTRLRVRLYRNLLRQEIGFFDSNNSGTLTSYLGTDTTLVQEAMSQALPEAIVGAIKLLVISGAMLWISTRLALVTVGCVGFSIGFSTLFGKWMGQWTKQYYDIYGGAMARAYQAFASMRMVQSFAAEGKEEDFFRSKLGEPNTWWPKRDGENDTTYSLGIRKSFVNASFYTFIFFSGFGSIYISMWFGFSIVIDGELSFGQLTAFQALMVQVAITVMTLSRFVKQLMDAQSASAHIFYLLDRVPSIPTPPPEDKSLASGYVPPTPLLKPKSMKGAIEFRDINFSYPSRPGVRVLDGVSLKIPCNSTCALVGPSGSGKSTLVALLQRFFDVDSGSVRIDGKDIRGLDLTWLRSHMGYVQQEPVLFDITVRENICYGVDREVDQEELEAVCRKANAHNFISAWPHGYETHVGERGVQLSGGQKQRIAIARALLVNPRLLLLDEATSALDAESEHLVQEAIDNAVAGRTVVVIAHRLSTIKHAHQIVVMDDHKINDVGTHEELLQRCEKYQQLIKRQQKRND